MPTLSQITSETKSTIKWGIIGLIVLILLYFGIKIGGFLKEAIFPTPAPKPTVAFGKLPLVALPENPHAYNFTYTIDTLSGKLPDFSDRINIYKMVQKKIDLLSFQRAKERAATLGFSSTPITVSDTVYEWANPESTIGKKLTLNSLGNEFNIDSNFYADEKILAGKNLPSEGQAISIANSYLASNSMLPETIDEEKTKATLFSIKNYTLIPSTSVADSQLIQVNFFEKNVDKKPIVYKSPYTPNISIYITGGEDSNQIVKADYFYQEISKDSATYPIKTTEQALKELIDGKAFFASVPSSTQEVSIKDMYLAYYMPSKNQEYLLPVFVFTGNNGFYAYVPAVTDEWISN
jgi:hypothetical protein